MMYITNYYLITNCKQKACLVPAKLVFEYYVFFTETSGNIFFYCKLVKQIFLKILKDPILDGLKLQSSKFSSITAYYYNRATTHGTRILSFSHLVNATTEPDNIFSKRLLLSRPVIPKYLANRVGAPRTRHILYFSLHSSHYFKFGRRVIIVCDGLTADLWLLVGKVTVERTIFAVLSSVRQP